MNGPETLIPLFAIFFLFGGPVVAFIITRVLAHQERIAMIQRGIVPPPRGFGGRGAYRQWAQSQPPGQPWNAAPPPYAAPAADDDDPQHALYKGIRLALIGLAIFIGLSFIGGTPGSPEFRGGPWLLGGLIPMFVGIAQIIIALLSGAQLPNGTRTTFIPPPPPPNPGTPPPPPPPYGAWEQPGRTSRFEELSKPAPPPDVR